jgi:hypothetical protein
MPPAADPASLPAGAPAHTRIAKRVREVDARTLRGGDGTLALPDELLRATEPWVCRGIGAAWPLVQAARRSPDDLDAYLRRFYNGHAVVAMLGPAEIDGRFHYNERVDGFNYHTVQARLDQVLDELKVQRGRERPSSVYVGSTAVDMALPGIRAENDLDLDALDPLVSIWIGNQTRISAHFDSPDNLAVVAAGQRRFTLFPPDQLHNLYVGPIDFNPAGQAISMVDFARPDDARFPRFAQALQHAEVAELDAGDAIFIPSMWWHHVEALASLNVLVNYWWNRMPRWMDNPTNTLMHALLSMRALPPEQRAAWQNIFRHYIFESDEASLAHIPVDARYVLSPLDEDGARALRAHVLQRINR